MPTARKNDHDIRADIARELAQAVLGAIHGTRGVREVSDHLSVESRSGHSPP